MFDLIGPALGAIEQGLKLANTLAAKSHIEKKTKILLKINEEEAKPLDKQDDKKIVALYDELKIWIEASSEIMKALQK